MHIVDSFRACTLVYVRDRLRINVHRINGALLSDHIEYELPFGKLGDLAQRLIINRQLHTTFAYRHARTSELLAQK